VFQNLNYGDLKNVGQVSQHFRTIASEPCLWKALARNNNINSLPLHLLSSLQAYEQAIKQILISHASPSEERIRIIRIHPTLRCIQFDMAYGHTFENFGETYKVNFENFDGVEVLLKTAENCVLPLRTSTPQITSNGVLYSLIPAESTPKTPAEALASLRSKLNFSAPDFPIQVSFKLNSGHADMNPPEGTTGSESFGLIASSGSDLNLTRWDLHYYPLNKIYTADPLTLESLFPTDEAPRKTIVLVNTDVNFGDPGTILFFKEPLDQIPHLPVIFEGEPDGDGNEEMTLINAQVYEDN
jgi:hypothetical protein